MANDLISYRASIGMFYCSTHCIYVYKNVIVSISPIDEIFYLLDLQIPPSVSTIKHSGRTQSFVGLHS